MTENTTTDYALEDGDGVNTHRGTTAAQGGGGGGGGGGGSNNLGNTLSFENAKRAATYVGAKASVLGSNIQDGTVTMRVMAFVAALAVVVTSILDFCSGLLHINITHVLLSIVVCAFSVIICILEGREHLPQQIRKFQSLLYAQAQFLRLITGRGLFYAFTGLLQFSHWSFLNMISGCFMMFVGVLYVLVGRSTGKKLQSVRSAITDETTLQAAFADHDSDHDGYLTQQDFNGMISSMDLNLNANEMVAAFTAIDEDDDGKVSFDEFKTWWTGSSLV